MLKKLLLLMLIFIILSSCTTEEEKKEFYEKWAYQNETFPLVNLQFKSKKSTSGFFFLGIGGFSSSENSYYYFYFEDTKEDIIRFVKINPYKCAIRFGKKPSIKIIYGRKYADTFEIWIRKCILIIPRNSIKRDFNLKIK